MTHDNAAAPTLELLVVAARTALDLGDVSAAEQYLKQASHLATDAFTPHFMLGELLFEQRRFRRAAKSLTRATELDSEHAEAHYLLSASLLGIGRDAEALQKLERALVLDPKHAKANTDMGIRHVQRGDPAKAITFFTAACAGETENPKNWINLGNAQLMARDLTEAVESYERALTTSPNEIDAFIGAATALRHLTQFEDAERHARAAVAVRPNDPVTLNLLGTILRESGKLDEAMSAFDAALEIAPNDPNALTNRAMLLLLLGDLAHGFQQYDARLQHPSFRLSWPRIDRPVWDGSIDRDKSLIIYGEQGFGDTIQAARFVHQVKERVGKIHFAVQPELAGLFKAMDPEVHIVESGDRLSNIDMLTMAMSLPGTLGIDSNERISGAPYLTAPAPTEAMTQRLTDLNGLKVGINWRGSKMHKEDAKRSVTLDIVRPIFDALGSPAVSLAFGDNAPCPPELLDVSDLVKDFSDSAALIAGLDLIISVDTATVHLAGALGVPCWLMLPAVPDWRWQLTGETTPWYDSLTLFRQPSPGDWKSVISHILTKLKKHPKLID